MRQVLRGLGYDLSVEQLPPAPRFKRASPIIRSTSETLSRRFEPLIVKGCVT
jgi:hypothetical protein